MKLLGPVLLNQSLKALLESQGVLFFLLLDLSAFAGNPSAIPELASPTTTASTSGFDICDGHLAFLNKRAKREFVKHQAASGMMTMYQAKE